MSNPLHQELWKKIKDCYNQAQKDWIRDELPKFNPETLQPREVLQKARAAVFGALALEIERQWSEDLKMQECLPLDRFDKKGRDAMGSMYVGWGSEVEDAIREWTDTWTESREAMLTSLIQAVDEAPSIARANNLWSAGLMEPILRYVSQDVLARHEKLTRALCAKESTIEGISRRCWLQFQRTEDESEAKMIVDEHLERYGEVKDVVLDRLVAGALTTLERSDIDFGYKKAIGRHLLSILGAMGHGLTRHEGRIFKSWWRDLKEGRGHTEEGWKKGQVKWSAIDMNHLRDEPDNQVPLLMYRAQMELSISKELVSEMMRDYLSGGETAG
jgi:hypothetical protein